MQSLPRPLLVVKIAYNYDQTLATMRFFDPLMQIRRVFSG